MPLSVDVMHPAASIIKAAELEGYHVVDLLAFTRRSTILAVQSERGRDILKVFFGSDHVLDSIDSQARSRAYGFYWYALKTDAERQFEIEAVQAEIAITERMSGTTGWPTVVTNGSINDLRFIRLREVPGVKLTLPYEITPPGVVVRLRWLRSVAEALVALHSAGIVHRDIYHENVLVHNDSATVIDFGCARWLHTPSGPATRGPEIHWAPEYMNDYRSALPEADIFGLGVMLHRTVTGDIPRPWSHERLSNLASRPLADVVLACLDPNPASRPSARDVLDQLVFETNC